MMAPSMLRRWGVEHDFYEFFSLALSPAGLLLAGGRSISTGVGDDIHGVVALWDPATGREVRRWDVASRAVTSVAFSPDGRLLAAVSRTPFRRLGAWKALTMWDLDGERELISPAGEIAAHSVAFSRDGTCLAIAGLGMTDTVVLLDAASGVEVQRLAGHVGGAGAVAFNRDGTLLATGGQDEMLRIWELTEGREIAAHRGWRAVHAVAFAPDGASVAAGDAYGGVRVWDVATGDERYSLFGPADHTAYSLAYNADGTLLAGAFGEEHDHRGAVLLWRFDTGNWRTTMAGATGSVTYAVAMGPDGHTLASVGDADLELWDVR